MPAVVIQGPVLETDRLILRLPHARDLDAYAAYNATPRAQWTAGPRDADESFRHLATQVGHWAFRGFGMFAVEQKGQDEASALVGLWMPPAWPEGEIGWLLWREEDEGKGIASEAARAVRNWAAGTLGWTTAVSYIHADNTRSRALAERLGAWDDTAASPKLAKYPDTLIYRHPMPEAA